MVGPTTQGGSSDRFVLLGVFFDEESKEAKRGMFSETIAHLQNLTLEGLVVSIQIGMWKES